MSSLRRRQFFRDAATRMIKPLARYIEERMHLPETRPHLRPPGAIEETNFDEMCYRCGTCVEVCPANAIFPLEKTEGDSSGTPVIDPDRAACVVCEGVKCTHACPSGALVPIHDPHQIRIGLAVVHELVCVRSSGQHCRICVERCPLGETAIRFNNGGPPEVLTPGCVGCGVCQQYCPTTPKAIVVRALR